MISPSCNVRPIEVIELSSDSYQQNEIRATGYSMEIK